MLGDLQIVAKSLRSGIEIIGGSIECASEKEVSGESIVVLSLDGNVYGTQTGLISL